MKVFMSLTLCMSAALAFAQEVPKIPERYYPKRKISSIEILLGPNLSTIHGIHSFSQYVGGGGDYHLNYTNLKMGVSFGIGLTHVLSKHFELNAKLLLESKGIEEKTDSVSFFLTTGNRSNPVTISTQSTSNQYLTITLMPSYFTGNKVRFYFGAGLYFGILKSSNITNNYYYPTPYKVSYDGIFDDYDYGVSISTGSLFELNSQLKLNIAFTSSFGLTQISAWRNNIGISPWYNNSYSLLVGIRYERNNKMAIKY